MGPRNKERGGGPGRVYRLRALGLVVDLSWRGLSVRRERNSWGRPTQGVPLDWVQYCVQLRRR